MNKARKGICLIWSICYVGASFPLICLFNLLLMGTKLYLKFFLVLILACSLTSSRAQTLSQDLEAIADIVVDINGSGDYLTIREAIGAIPDSSTETTVLLVKKGTYDEKVILNHKKWNVVLVGEDVDSTIITGDDYGDQMLPGGHTFSTYTFRADPHGFQAYNISFQNTTRLGQGVAYHSNGDKQILYHCKLLGYQDTYFDNFRTRRYIKDCLIEGATDYIFGWGVTLFDSCQIHSIASGWITAAATPEHYEFGYVFKDCYLISPGRRKGVKLGRPWFPYSNVTFFQCYESDDISYGGWDDWSGRKATAIYREYNCFGPGNWPERRFDWAGQLDSSLAPRYNIDTIFAASNFPSHMGPEVDSIEFWSMRDRFEASGYADRADTILYAGRDYWPDYPTDNWVPEYYDEVYQIVNQYTTQFVDTIRTEYHTGIFDQVQEEVGVEVLSPAKDMLRISTNRPLRNVTLTLFDLSGKQVAVTHAEAVPVGVQELSIESLGLLPGVYVYRIETAEQVYSNKVLIN